MKLYELSREYEALSNLWETGEIPDEAARDTLEGIAGEAEEKADNIACMVKNLNAEAKAMKEEEDRLSERRKALEHKADYLKKYLLDNLTLMGLKSVKTARNAISVRQATPQGIMENEDQFVAWATMEHEEFLKITPPAPNKTAIRDALKNGEELPGAKLEAKPYITIR